MLARSRRDLSGWLYARPSSGALVEQFRVWALPPAGLRHPRVPSGHLMSVQSVCLGWHWQPYAYSRTADDTDGAPVKPLPSEHRPTGPPSRRRHVRRRRPPSDFEPDAVIANLYAPGARLGLHQDAEEPSDAPVVTISLGDTCVFRIAGVDRRTAPFIDIRPALGRPARVRWTEPTGVPRRPEGLRQHRAATSSACRPDG